MVGIFLMLHFNLIWISRFNR